MFLNLEGCASLVRGISSLCFISGQYVGVTVFSQARLFGSVPCSTSPNPDCSRRAPGKETQTTGHTHDTWKAGGAGQEGLQEHQRGGPAGPAGATTWFCLKPKPVHPMAALNPPNPQHPLTL